MSASSTLRFHLTLWRSLTVVVQVTTVLAAFLMVPHTMSGAEWWTKINVDPELTRAGEMSTVRVHTLQLVGAGCLDKPVATPVPVEMSFSRPRREMKVIATGPDGQEQVFFVEKTTRDRTIWEGRTVFPVSGQWTLELTDVRRPQLLLPMPDPCNGTTVVLTVLPSEGATPGASPAATPVT